MLQAVAVEVVVALSVNRERVGGYNMTDTLTNTGPHTPLNELSSHSLTNSIQ